MTAQFVDLLERLVRPDQPGTFSVIPAPSQPTYYVGRDDSGCAALLIRTSGASNRVPLLLAGIEARIQVHDLIIKLRTVVADTLGRDMQTALGWSFDLARATSSARVYDVSTISAIRPPLPAGVSGVRFLVDLSGCRQLGRARIDALASHERALLPP